MSRFMRWLAMSLIATMLSGCGGGRSDTTKPIFSSSPTATVAENQTSAITLKATDTNTVTYGIKDGDANSFALKANTGVVTFKDAPDYETKSSYSFTATATDAYNNEATQSVTITILDDNCTDGDEIWHLGTQYCAVESNITDKVWLDRNLGASMECNESRDSFGSPDDAAVDAEYTASQKDCFGDYYQWGRNHDGHEDSNSSHNDIQKTNVNDTDGNFTTDDGTYREWVKDTDSDGSLRSANWSATDGSSICPAGYRVPTIDELKAELLDTGSAEIQNREDAYNSFLKLPSSGYRDYTSASMEGNGSYGYIWSSSANGGGASSLYFESGDASWYANDIRAYGYSVRCLRD